MTAYYNENDKKAAAWLRELIKDGLIADGYVDERSITEITPGDLSGFAQCHLFAGIGGWSLALRMAGVPDDWEVWTGSCPCQPFSAAGKGKGTDDERHLWPAFRWLISQRNPAITFGEQVASPAGRDWLSGVCLDLEAMGYVVGAADLCAAGVGAPHISQRLWWMARGQSSESQSRLGARTGRVGASAISEVSGVAHNNGDGLLQTGESVSASGVYGPIRNSALRRMGDPDSPRFQKQWRSFTDEKRHLTSERSGEGHWNGETTLWPCQDGKHRRIPAEPSLFPLAARLPGGVGLLRGAGNAIVPAVAAEFIRASLLSLEDMEHSKQKTEQI